MLYKELWMTPDTAFIMALQCQCNRTSTPTTLRQRQWRHVTDVTALWLCPIHPNEENLEIVCKSNVLWLHIYFLYSLRTCLENTPQTRQYSYVFPKTVRLNYLIRNFGVNIRAFQYNN